MRENSKDCHSYEWICPPAAHLQAEADEAEARRCRHLKALVLACQRGDGLRQADVVPEQARPRVSACQQESTQAVPVSGCAPKQCST